ncbi:ISL3 family transposase [Streptomyces zaomyceticus]
MADLATAGRKVVIDIVVRRFLCGTPGCGRRTFVEQVEGLTERIARRTPILRRTLERLALALAGRPAARLATHLSIPRSANSLFRLLGKLPERRLGTAPRVLGVDDFAFKRGHAYGTILMDVETGERVDVLPDRTADTLTDWLRAHPGVEIVCRERASACACAEAVRTARPDARQVADRFHLWKNLCEAVEKCIGQQRTCLAEPTKETTADKPVVNAGTAAADVPEPMEGLRAIQRRERHAAVHGLYDKGVAIEVIAKTLGLDRKTLRRYAHAANPDYAFRRYGHIHAYSPYLYRRWNERCTDAARLHTEIVELGYGRSKRTVRRHLQEIRAGGKPAPGKPKELTVRKATWLMTAHPDKIDESSALKLKQLLVRCPELRAVADCARLRPHDDRAPRHRTRRLAHPRRGHRPQAAVQPGPWPAPGLRRRHRRIHPGMELRQGRRQRQQSQTDQERQIRPGRIQLAPQADPPRGLSTVTLRGRTTRSGSEP